VERARRGARSRCVPLGGDEPDTWLPQSYRKRIEIAELRRSGLSLLSSAVDVSRDCGVMRQSVAEISRFDRRADYHLSYEKGDAIGRDMPNALTVARLPLTCRAIVTAHSSRCWSPRAPAVSDGLEDMIIFRYACKRC
jgi:hypothetical protein